MRSLFRENIGEALVGLFVVAFAAWFVMFAWDKTGGGERAGIRGWAELGLGELSARFAVA